MIKIDIMSLSGLTANDGSDVPSGAIVKFQTIFSSGSNDVHFILEVYRNRELFEAGYRQIYVTELPTDFIIKIPDDIYYVITPQMIYEIVKNHLNETMGSEWFEINIITIDEPEQPPVEDDV